MDGTGRDGDPVVVYNILLVVVVGHFESDALVATFYVEAFVCFGAVEDCLGERRVGC